MLFKVKRGLAETPPKEEMEESLQLPRSQWITYVKYGTVDT